ncbi:MAG: hypothetical protein PHV68_03735 [Candidatus Gastranaerophilales bacterium]|nr:hypothetical protein [Candidatus Gastranaerophilales bacterium]
MSVLLSIKPKYVKEIIEGKKLYEFRKAIFRKKTDKIIVYESSPTKKIIGEFLVGKIIEDTPKNLWDNLRECSGIEEKEFFSYFRNKKLGFALEIKKFIEYKNPINPYKEFKNFTPPQSFCYFEEQKVS